MIKIQFGSGSNPLPGWINTEIHDADITKPLKWDPASVDHIFAEHVFEHIDPHQAMRFLQDCYRILKPGGTIRLCVPTLEALPIHHALDIIFNHGHKATYTHNLLHQMLRVAGFQRIQDTPRKDIDGHWRVIGKEKDDLETCRIEATR